MAGTRASSRISSQSSAPAGSPEKTANGNKRKAQDSPKEKQPTKKQQTKLEDVGVESNDSEKPEVKNDQDHDQDMKDVAAEVEAEESKASENGINPKAETPEAFKGKTSEGEDRSDPEKALKDHRGHAGLNSMSAGKDDKPSEDVPKDEMHAEQSATPAITDESRPQETEAKQTTTATESKDKSNGNSIESHSNGNGTSSSNGDNKTAVQKDDTRAQAMPSNILERGMIYFFSRGRVGVEDMESPQDVQRSFFVLRPLPKDTKLVDGALPDLKNNRLFALPKKVFPKSGNDKFMAFVEKAPTTIQDLKDNFFKGNEYTTATVGVRQNPPVTPIGEGVYAITSVGGRSESHLAYMLTIPREPGDVQRDMGIRNQGSFVLSLKNPTAKGPANASLPQGPGFPQEFIDEFRGRSWMPVKPEHLDYANAQILMIGEDLEESHALDAAPKDEKSSEKETPREELEKMHKEDHERVEHLKGDDAVYVDLGISKKAYPDVATTW